MDYKDSGVNTLLGDEVSRIFYNAAKVTWKNRKNMFGEIIDLYDDFSGIRAINVGLLPYDSLMGINFDGVGTKIEIAERISNHESIAFDLFAMVCDDAVIRGAEPVVLGSILDIRKIDSDISSTKYINQLAKGYINAAREANVAVVNGEVAEIGARVLGYGEFNYNWGAGVVWFVRKKNIITGYKIREGDKIIGLRETGFRSNGLSLVRKVFSSVYGDEWHKEVYNNKPLGELSLIPSKIYTRAVLNITGGFSYERIAEVHGISHITGGGIPGKLGRTLKPTRFGAYLDDLFEPCDLMKLCQEKGNITDEEAYRTWNMGQGMLIITPDYEKVLKSLDSYEIESKVVGEIIKDRQIIIKSKGIFSDGSKEIRFDLSR
ncbi:MAG: AIR synthase-related protein [Candidatus Pacearchaeota archaeon]